MKSCSSIAFLVVLLIFLSAVTDYAKAQSNLAMFNSGNQSISSDYNPAKLLGQEQYSLGVFPFAGMNVAYNNQAVINRMLRNVLRGDTTQSAYRDVFKGLVSHGLFTQRFETSLFQFGYNHRVGSFHFRVRDVEQMMIDFKGNFTDFILNQSATTLFLNQSQFLPATALHYREYSLAFARELVEKRLSVGVRAKLYFGKAAFVSDIYGALNLKNDTFRLNTTGMLKLSAPVRTVINDREVLQPFETNPDFSVSGYLFNSKNPGTGLDLGIVYTPNEQVSISASLLDLGIIHWKTDLQALLLKGEIALDDDLVSVSGTNAITKGPGFAEEVEDNFDLFKVDSASQRFSTPLPVHIYAGIQYKHNANLSFGIVNRYIYLKNLAQNSLMFSVNYLFSEKVSLNTGYSVIGNSYFNIPFGLVYTWESGHSFIGTDNLFSLLLPSLSDFTGIAFGTSFYLFRKKIKYRKAQEYLPFYREIK